MYPHVPIEVIIISDVPGEPGTPQIVSFDQGTAALRWTAPRSDGGSPINNYRVEMRTAGAYRWELVNIADTIRDTQHTVRVSNYRHPTHRQGK